MEGTFHYMLMAEQAMVQKHILRTLKDTGLTMGQPKVTGISHGTRRGRAEGNRGGMPRGSSVSHVDLKPDGAGRTHRASDAPRKPEILPYFRDCKR